MNNKNTKISEEIKELVIERLSVMPSEYKLSIGSDGTFTKDQLIEHVKSEDSIGNQITNIQMNFIKALTTGKFMETINKNG
ncbi:MAG: hypothetical protein ABIB79_03720 [archaeon]